MLRNEDEKRKGKLPDYVMFPEIPEINLFFT